MTQARKSNQHGVLRDEMTERPQDMQSTNAGSPSISDTSGTSVPLSPSFQATEKSPASSENPNVANARLVVAFANRLGKLVEWRNIELGDGRTGYALFFSSDKWRVDPVSQELVPRRNGSQRVGS